MLQVVDNNLVLLHAKVGGISANSLGTIEIIDEMPILWRDASFSLVLNDRGIQVPASEATAEVLGFENAAYTYFYTSTYSEYAVRYHGINYVFSNRETVSLKPFGQQHLASTRSMAIYNFTIG